MKPADDTAPPDPLAEVSPVLAGLVGASVQGRVALGPRAGARVRHLGDEPDLGHVTSRGPRQAQLDGFDLYANVWVPPDDQRAPARSPPPHPATPGAWTWPALMRRVFDFDVLTCPRCGGRHKDQPITKH